MHSKIAKSIFKYPSLILFMWFLVLYLSAGHFLAYDLQIFHNDAVARTALGFFTTFGRNPHLAAVGFIWQPLPSLLQVPLLVLLRPLGFEMMAGPMVSSVLGAASVVLLYKISRLMGRKHSTMAAVIAILYGLNPMILLYVAMGASEIVFIFSLIAFSYFLVKWVIKNDPIYLVLSTFLLATGFGSRYESIPAFMAALLVILLVQLWRKDRLGKIEGTLINFAVPFVYAVTVWILLNWAIMGNPFYFMNSVYSNAGFTNQLKQSTAGMEFTYASIPNSVWYAVQRVALLAPALLLSPVYLVQFFKQRLRNVIKNGLVLLALLAPYGAILAFHVYQLVKGESFGWLRFFMYAIVAATLWAMFVVKKWPKLRWLVLLLLVLGCVTSAYAMSVPAYGKEENSFVRKIMDPTVTLDYTRTYADQKAVAAFMDSHPGKVLIDTDEGFAVPLFAKDPTRYVITSDVDYKYMVEHCEDEVQWVIVPTLNADNVRKNVILLQYPDIWSGSDPRLQLYRKIDGWGVFEVRKITIK